MGIEYPIEVNEIKFNYKMPFDCYGMGKNNIGQLVKIRPCADEYKDKTYLGLFLGDVTLSPSVHYNREEKILDVTNGMSNPAIFVFDLKKVIYGCGSWWGVIKSEEELDKLITDETIENVWYVKMLKELSKKDKKENSPDDN